MPHNLPVYCIPNNLSSYRVLPEVQTKSLLMPGLIPFDYHDTDVILFVVFFLRPGNDSIYNKANSYGHIPISFNASILNSPLSPNFGNAAEEGRMPSVYKNGAIDSCTLDSEDGTTHANQEKLALGTWVSSHFIRRCSYLRLIG